MGQESVNQKNFNVGEVDPLLASRADLKVYFAGLALAENVVTTPLGPLMRRPGSVFIDYVRHELALIPVTAGLLLTPSGGTAADAVTADGTLFTTTSALGAADEVILEVDFAGPLEVHLIDLIDYAAIPTGGGGGAPAPDPAPPSYTWTPPPGTPGSGSDFGPGVQLP